MATSSKKVDILSKRTLMFVKKARKQMRKLRKATAANAQHDVMLWAQKQITELDAMIDNQKKARSEKKEARKIDVKK
jgi:hypothetical protein